MSGNAPPTPDLVSLLARNGVITPLSARSSMPLHSCWRCILIAAVRAAGSERVSKAFQAALPSR